MLHILTIAVSALLLIAATGAEPLGRQTKLNQPRNYFRRAIPFEVKTVKLQVDGGWYAFNFGLGGIPVRQAFHYFSDVPTYFSVQDAFCSGDMFDVYDHGRFLTSSTAPTFYSLYPCAYYFEEVNYIDSYDYTVFSYVYFPLTSGYHNLTIVPTTSPLNKGTAFLQARKSCGSDACCYATMDCNTRIIN